MGAGGNLASIAAFKHAELGKPLNETSESWRAVQGQPWQRHCLCSTSCLGPLSIVERNVGEGHAPSLLLPVWSPLP